MSQTPRWPTAPIPGLGLSRQMALAGLMVFALLGHGGPALAGSFPQVKMDFVDVSEAPTVTIGFSFLTTTLKAVQPKFIDVLDIMRHRSDQDPRGTAIRKLVKGKPNDKTKDGELMTADKAERPVDAVIVVAGYGNVQFTESELGPGIRSALSLVLKKFPKSGRMNLLWVGDLLWSHVRAQGRVGSLTRLNTEQNRKLCRASRLEWYERGDQAPGDPEAEEQAPIEPACGLAANDGSIADIVKSKARFEGFYPALFGLHDKYPETPGHENRALQGYRADEDGKVERPPVAMDEALRLLLLSSTPDTPKALILISDGRDGYTESLDMWRQRWKETCEERYGSSRKLRDQVSACVTDLETGHLTNRETFFAARVTRWLPLLRAARVRVLALGLPTGTSYELNRLRLLAEMTGGTYREAQDVESLEDAAAALIGELGGQLVVRFTDPEILGGQTVGYSVSARASRRNFASRALFAEVPEIVAGPRAAIHKAYAELKRAVGSPWHIVILVVAALILLLLLFLILKLSIKIVKAIVKKLFKKGGGALKQGAKGKLKPPSMAGRFPK